MSRFLHPSDRQVSESNQQAKDEASVEPPNATAIRAFYARATGSMVKQFGLTSFEMGLGMSDYGAFEDCAQKFGYVNSIFALRAVSARAKERHSAHVARKNRSRP